jgi:acetyl esterase/lipase
LTYATASGFECKLDVYRPAGAVAPVPTVIFIHGGGWVAGSKESAVLHLLPYLEMGFAVVNVEYRLAKLALAPAAVEDVRRALRWVWANAKTYAFDTTKIVVTGGSAGGHLALMCGMLDASAGFDQTTGWDPVAVTPKVAAIVNWYGITDVADLMEGPNYQQYAAAWLGSLPNRKELAKAVSPLTYLRKNTPPIFTVHGDADQLVPYQHAVRLHEGLKKSGVKNDFVTIPGGRHGGFSKEQTLMIHQRIRAFLKDVGIEAT